MTVIRPNSISGVTSITALANEINVFKHDGVLAGLQLNGVNHHTSSGVSTFHTLNVLGNVSVGGTLTYQDVTNVDSLGIGTFRTGINVSGGQLDVGSNIKLGNAGVITATSFVGSGANLTGITQVGGSTGVDFNDNVKARFGTGNDLEIYHNAVSNILATSNGNIELVAGSEYMAKFIPNGEVQLYNNNTRRLRVTSGGLSIQATDAGGSEHFGRFYFKQESGTVRGLFDPAAQKFSVYDNSQFTVGNDRDAVFFHDGSNTILLNNTGNLLIRNDGTSTTEEILIQPKSGENSIRAIANGAVELYHDSSQKFTTTSYGISIGGSSGSISGAAGIEIGNAATSELRLKNTSGGSGSSDGFGIQKWSDGNTYIYEYDPHNFIIGTNGASRWIIGGTTGHITPFSNNTYDIGSSSSRVRNIYTNDLNLSNKGSTNSVDNTWGDYTIQEGESDLFLINNRNGKKYKFNLTEVS